MGKALRDLIPTARSTALGEDALTGKGGWLSIISRLAACLWDFSEEKLFILVTELGVGVLSKWLSLTMIEFFFEIFLLEFCTSLLSLTWVILVKVTFVGDWMQLVVWKPRLSCLPFWNFCRDSVSAILLRPEEGEFFCRRAVAPVTDVTLTKERVCEVGMTNLSLRYCLKTVYGLNS